MSDYDTLRVRVEQVQEMDGSVPSHVVDALLDAIDDLTAERDAAVAHARHLQQALDNTFKDRDKAQADADRMRHTLAAVLARFTDPGHIRAAGDCLRTGWVPSGLVNEWRALVEVTRG